MKDLKHQTRPGNLTPVREVILKVRDYQVTVKVKSSVPQVPSSAASRPSFR